MTGTNIHFTQMGVEDEAYQRNAASQITKSNSILKECASPDGIRSDKISFAKLLEVSPDAKLQEISANYPLQDVN